MSPPTHYEVLGVARSASPDQVRAAYRSAARDHHPDAGGDPGRMRALNAAWQVLGDPARRAAYDRELASRASSRGSAGNGGPGSTRAAGPGSSPTADDWPPEGDDLDVAADLRADLADGDPLRETMALEGWWAILPPGTLLAAVGLMVGAVFFTSPAMLALSGGTFVLALGLFVLAPLRAMAQRRDR